MLVADLVSRGYVVVTVDHTYETPIEFPGGRLVEAGIPSDPPDLKAAKELYMATRAADLLHVIARLDELAHPVMELSRLGIFGHSAGGLDAVRAAITRSPTPSGSCRSSRRWTSTCPALSARFRPGAWSGPTATTWPRCSTYT